MAVYPLNITPFLPASMPVKVLPAPLLSGIEIPDAASHTKPRLPTLPHTLTVPRYTDRSIPSEAVSLMIVATPSVHRVAHATPLNSYVPTA